VYRNDAASLADSPGQYPLRMGYVLAQVNIGRTRGPMDGPVMADFMAALDPVNAVADAASGFIWRMQTEDGNATAISGFEWEGPDVIVNMSVWESIEALAEYTYRTAAHRDVLRQRRSWFEPLQEAHMVLWWVPRGHIPTIGEAEERLLYLREHGATPYAFTFRTPFPPPDGGDEPLQSSADWKCPA
jgi:Domain of unknown function (DUF3291)